MHSNLYILDIATFILGKFYEYLKIMSTFLWINISKQITHYTVSY